VDAIDPPEGWERTVAGGPEDERRFVGSDAGEVVSVRLLRGAADRYLVAVLRDGEWEPLASDVSRSTALARARRYMAGDGAEDGAGEEAG
jgi:hypothetical protein